MRRPKKLLAEREWKSQDGKISWELKEGDFLETFKRCGCA